MKLRRGHGAAAHAERALRAEGVMLIAEGEFTSYDESSRGGGEDTRVRIGLGREGFLKCFEAWGVFCLG